MPKSYFSRQEAAKFLKMKASTLAVYAKSHANTLPYIILDGQAHYELNDLRTFQKKRIKGGFNSAAYE